MPAAGLDESALLAPEFEDAAANAGRARVLEEHRAWLRRDGVFGGFPEEVDWRLVGLAREEVLSILYIDWDWCLRASDGTRLPLDAAARIRAGEVPGSSVESHEQIAARLRSDDPPPELIVASTPDLSRLVAPEGPIRLTAYALFPDYLPGSSPSTSEPPRTWSAEPCSERGRTV